MPPRRTPLQLAAVAALASAVGSAPPLGAQSAPSSPPALAAPTAPAPRARTPRVVTLENGLQVIIVEDHAVPLATEKLVVRAGAMTQTPDDQGIPHLFEHMLFKGYRGVSDRPFAAAAADLHAAFNGTTSEEMVTYFLTGPSNTAADAVQLLAGLVRDARFENEDLRTERFVVLGELQRGESDPRGQLSRVVGRLLWGEGWYRKNTIGEPTALLGVAPPRLREIYGRYYVPNNAALVVTGDVDPERVIEAARRHLGPWRRRADPFAGGPPEDPPPLKASQVVALGGPVDAVTVLLQWQGPSVRTDRADTYAADVLSAVVDDEQSEMTHRLIDSGLFETAQIGYETLAHTGPVTFTGTTTFDKLAGALTGLAAELDFMRDSTYFGAPALAAAAKRRRVADALAAEEGPELAHTLGYWWAVAGLDYHTGYADALARQTPADLHRFVTRYLTGRPFVAGALVPSGREKETEVMLQQFASMVASDAAAGGQP